MNQLGGENDQTKAIAAKIESVRQGLSDRKKTLEEQLTKAKIVLPEAGSVELGKVAVDEVEKAKEEAQQQKIVQVQQKKQTMVEFINQNIDNGIKGTTDNLNRAGLVINVMGPANITKWSQVYQAMVEVEGLNSFAGVMDTDNSLKEFIRSQNQIKALNLEKTTEDKVVEYVRERIKGKVIEELDRVTKPAKEKLVLTAKVKGIELAIISGENLDQLQQRYEQLLSERETIFGGVRGDVVDKKGI